MIMLDPRAFDNTTKQYCLKKKSEFALAFGRACCRMEARSALCQNNEVDCVSAGQEAKKHT